MIVLSAVEPVSGRLDISEKVARERARYVLNLLARDHGLKPRIRALLPFRSVPPPPFGRFELFVALVFELVRVLLLGLYQIAHPGCILFITAMEAIVN